MIPTSLARYVGADLRLAVVDMDGTPLDDDKNFPPGMGELLDQMDMRGVILAPASGRRVWTLIDMFPGCLGMTVIGKNSGIIMRDNAEVSSHPVDTPTVREVIRLVRETISGPGGIDDDPVTCGKQFAYVGHASDRSVDDILPCYHRIKRVDDQITIIDAIEASEIDDTIVKLTVFVLGPVEALAEAILANFAGTHQCAISGASWADLQIRGVDKGSAVHDLQCLLGVDRSQTTVFGDAGNNLPMMNGGDLSFAVTSASQDVIETVRFIAPSNDEAGTIQVLRTLLG